MQGGICPEMVKPLTRIAGIPAEKHQMQFLLLRLVRLAKESYNAWLEEKRAAAA